MNLFSKNLGWGNIWDLTSDRRFTEFSDDHWSNKFRYKNYITRRDLEKRKQAVIDYEFCEDKNIWSIFSKIKNSFQDYVCELISKHSEWPQKKDWDK